MPILKAIRRDTILAGGSLIEYRLKEGMDCYLLQGGAGANLTGGVTVRQDAGDAVYEGLTYPIKYEGNFVYTGGNVITIFDVALSEVQATKNLKITATYKVGAGWEVDIEVDMSEAGVVTVDKLAADVYVNSADVTFGTGSYLANAVRLLSPQKLGIWFTDLLANAIGLVWAKLQEFTEGIKLTNIPAFEFVATDTDKKLVSYNHLETITKEISFESGEIGVNEIRVAYKFVVIATRACVTSPIAGTDDAVLVGKIQGTTITGLDPITIPMSSTLDTAISSVATASNAGNAGDILSFEAAKPTAGGRVCISIILKRIPE